MRIALNAEQTDDALDHIEQLTIQARAAHTLVRRRHLEDRDGYPTASLGGSGSATNELDDDGTPLPQHSDPTARIVIGRDEASDTIGIALANLVQNISDARRSLEAAISNAARAWPPVKIKSVDDTWCVSCLRINIHSPRKDDTRYCSWCGQWRAVHNKLPPLEIVQARADGRRITPKLIAESLPRNKKRKGRKR